MASTFNGQELSLKYLFTARFADGHEIAQTPEDVSKIEPEKRSAFFDVLEYEKKSPLVTFYLHEPDGHTLWLDLKTGNFSWDYCGWFDISDQFFIKDKPLRLIYFRETRKELNVQKTIGQPDKVIGESFYVNRYFIGWQTTWKGRNYQRTISVQ